MWFEPLLTGTMRFLTKRYFRLNEEQIECLPAPKPGRAYMLYAHVPFCETLCPYCSFNRFVYSEDRARAYFTQLRAEMHMVAGLGYSFDSLYIGGGTPTVLIDELIQTIELARSLFGIREVSCETNPNHLTPENARRLAPYIQRMSVGVQSFNDDMTRRMNRFERFGSGEHMLEQIRSVSGIFDFLNVDMIFNLPGQTAEMLRDDIDYAIRCGANQVTFYPLMSSPSVASSMAATLGEVSYNHEAGYYQKLVNELAGDFQMTTAWNFGRRQPAASSSGQAYMIDEYIVNFGEYVGVGSGSFSYLDGRLFVNTFSLSEYRQKIEAGRMSVKASASFGRRQQMQYRLMMDLFSLRLDKQAFKREFGISLERGLPLELNLLRLLGAFQTDNRDELTLSPAGRYILLVMMREFFVAINGVRDQARSSLPAAERLQQCAQPADSSLLPGGAIPVHR